LRQTKKTHRTCLIAGVQVVVSGQKKALQKPWCPDDQNEARKSFIKKKGETLQGSSNCIDKTTFLAEMKRENRWNSNPIPKSLIGKNLDLTLLSDRGFCGLTTGLVFWIFLNKKRKRTNFWSTWTCFCWKHGCTFSKAQWGKEKDLRKKIAAKFACHMTHSFAKIKTPVYGLAVSSACCHSLEDSSNSSTSLALVFPSSSSCSPSTSWKICGQLRGHCEHVFFKKTRVSVIKMQKKWWTFFAGQSCND